MGRYAAGVILGLALIAGASPAAAATTVGQVDTGPNPTDCPALTGLVTTSVSDGPTFTVPTGGGVITSWQTNAGAGADQSAKLKILRATAAPATYLVVGQSAFRPITASLLNGPLPVRIPVQSGDFVSILTGANGGPCQTVTSNPADISRATTGGPDSANGTNASFPTPLTGRRANVSASLEPDADRDGFGDETQDQCPSDPSAQGACPVAAAPPPVTGSGGRAAAIKRCKKKFPHGKKRKHCVRKAKRLPA
jgi:hypothetical protein